MRNLIVLLILTLLLASCGAQTTGKDTRVDNVWRITADNSSTVYFVTDLTGTTGALDQVTDAPTDNTLDLDAQKVADGAVGAVGSKLKGVTTDLDQSEETTTTTITYNVPLPPLEGTDHILVNDLRVGEEYSKTFLLRPYERTPGNPKSMERLEAYKDVGKPVSFDFPKCGEYIVADPSKTTCLYKDQTKACDPESGEGKEAFFYFPEDPEKPEVLKNSIVFTPGKCVDTQVTVTY